MSDMLLRDEKLRNIYHEVGRRFGYVPAMENMKATAKAQFLVLVKWLMEPCPKTQHSSPIGTKRINCPDCMAELKAEAKRINEVEP